jgi:hypothetical protein
VAGIAKLLIGAGVEDARASHRADCLYWANLGQAVVMSASHASLPAAALDDIGNLFEA